MKNSREESFGEFIARKRAEKKITLREMARLLKITPPYLSDIEKSRRNPPERKRLDQIAAILLLSEDEYSYMYNLAGRQRNEVPIDLPDYIIDRDYVCAALRVARDLEAGEDEWMKFVEDLKKRKG